MLSRESLIGPSRRASRQSHARLVCAVVEYGSQRPSVDPAQGVLLLQAEAESSGAFARRVGTELTKLQTRAPAGDTVAMLSLARGVSDTQIEARCAIGAAISRCFAGSDTAIVLLCDARATRDERAHALALVEGLSEGFKGRNVVAQFASPKA
jgi:hypothetical protein